MILISLGSHFKDDEGPILRHFQIQGQAGRVTLFHVDPLVKGLPHLGHTAHIAIAGCPVVCGTQIYFFIELLLSENVSRIMANNIIL